ncbi:unnamed protein product [Calypogeia fissa]
MSSKTSEEPCAHQQHDFKQEIEDSIRRCEELLSMAPMSYQSPDGWSFNAFYFHISSSSNFLKSWCSLQGTH